VGGGKDDLFVFLELVMRLDAGVVNGGHFTEELLLGFSIGVSDDSLLVGVQGKKTALFGGSETLVGLAALLDFRLEDGEKGVVFVGHGAGSDSVEGRLERGGEDLALLCGRGDGLGDLGKGLFADGVDDGLEVVVLVSLDGLEHTGGSVVHVVLKGGAGVAQEVDEGSLFDELVLLVNTDVFHLFLGVDEVSDLRLLDNISPLLAQLLGLVARVHIVEDGELGSHEESEMTHFHVGDEVGDQELMVEDHTSQPLVVVPSTEVGNGDDTGDVGVGEDETSAGAGEGLVVRGNLLGTNSLEQSLHVAEMGVDEGVGVSVVGVHVAGVVLVELVGVVTLAVLGCVLGLRTKSKSIY